MARKILVVDDEQDIRSFMTTLLEDNGYEVRTAGKGHEAFAAVQEDRPDLVLLDLQMPEGTGTDFYRKMHSKKELQDIPVIVISGVAGRKVAVSKSVVVLDKPLDEKLVLEEIKKALSE